MGKKTVIVFLTGLMIMIWLTNPVRAQIARDKELHFQAGFYLSSLFYGLHTYGPSFDGSGLSKVEYRALRRRKALKWGIGIAVAAGAAKELADAAGMGTPEWEDFVYTVYGGLAGALLCLVLDHILSGFFDFIVEAGNQRKREDRSLLGPFYVAVQSYRL